MEKAIYSETKELILTAAREVFANHGYGAATMKKIAREANVNITTMQNYYASKQDIVRALYHTFYRKIAYILAEPVAGMELVEYTAFVLSALAHVFEQDREIAWMLFAQTPNCIVLLREKRNAQLLRAVRKLVNRLVTLDLLVVDNIDSYANLCYGSTHFALMQWLSGGWDIEKPELLNHLLVFLLRGAEVSIGEDHARYALAGALDMR